MIKFIKQLFTIEKQPKKGLFALEWVVLAYLVLTLLIVFFTYTKAANPDAMIWVSAVRRENCSCSIIGCSPRRTRPGSVCLHR